MSARTVWLLVRHGLQESWGATAALAVVALLAAAVLTAAPRAVDRLHTEQLAFEAGRISTVSRDVALTPARDTTVFTDWVPGALREPPWEGLLDDLSAVRDTQPEPMRAALGAPHVVLSGPQIPVEAAVPTDLGATFVVPRAAPDLADHARLVEGAWPEVTMFGLDYGPGSVVPPILPPGATVADIEPVQIAISRQAAERVGWEIGHLQPRVAPLPPLEVVGVYEPLDPAEGYWAHAFYGAAPLVYTDPLVGKVAVLAATVAGPVVAPLSQGRVQLTGWLPLDLNAVAGPDVRPLATQLRAAASHVQAAPHGGVPVRATSGSLALLDRVLAARAGTDAVLAVIAAGPLGALLVVLALGARLVVERRRSALALLRVRGADPGQLRTVAAAEGAIAGLPGAGLGVAAGLLAVPGRLDAGQALLALGAGLAPAVALAATASGARLRHERSDLGHGPRWRRWAELLVLAGAAVATVLLVSRGAVAQGGVSQRAVAQGAASAAAVDPLVALAPPLLCLAVALLVARALPWAATPVERAFARGRGLTGFLGAAGARRDTAGGVLPAIALVLCVAVAGSSSVLRTTVERGIDAAVWERVGADVRISDVWVQPAQADALRALDGVAAVATLGTAGRGSLTAEGVPGTGPVTVLTIDAAALAAVQAGVPGAPSAAPLAALTSGDPAGPLPVLVSAGVGLGDVAVGALSRVASADPAVPVRVAGVLETLPGAPPAARFVVVDAARAAEVLGVADRPNVALARLDPGATEGTLAAVRGVLSPSAVTETFSAAAALQHESPSTRALTVGTALALGLGALLAGLTLVLTLLLAAPSRTRLLAVLRTLGVQARQTRSLVAWETAPWLVVAVVAGVALTAIVPAVVLAAVDLAPLTGGEAQPSARVAPWALAGIAAGLLLVAALAAAVAAGEGRRVVAAVLRTGQES